MADETRGPLIQSLAALGYRVQEMALLPELRDALDWSQYRVTVRVHLMEAYAALDLVRRCLVDVHGNPHRGRVRLNHGAFLEGISRPMGWT